MSMRIFEPLFVALSTYSAIPVPQFEWNERNMKYSICFFPAVGMLCGLALWLWSLFCAWLELSGMLFAAVAVCIPLLISGGIHMDGYMDTMDALSSHQPRERKLQIMKDPNCGAFAVIYCGIYLLLDLGLLYELYGQGAVFVYCPVYVLSRSLSALCAVNLPNARRSGMLCAYTQNADRKKATVAMLFVAVAAGAVLLLLSPKMGGCVLLAALLALLLYRRSAMKEFGGVTGDTSGFFLQLCELFCLLGALVGAYLR
ncbi:MAG: adenosylcobinamide-GDP ribazoletransferase [Oscillospiraceae bacterium]|nr:adenosylcobinamide-GDP ribazoletransferase [Oscillospiraceae bacterium]